MGTRYAAPDTSQAIVVGYWKSANNMADDNYKMCALSGGAVIKASAGTTKTAGIVANGGNASAVNVDVVALGPTELEIRDSVSPLDWLVPDANGYGTLTAIDSGNYYTVMALMSGATGDIIRVAVVPPYLA
jgi:hypothetical protein